VLLATSAIWQHGGSLSAATTQRRNKPSSGALKTIPIHWFDIALSAAQGHRDFIPPTEFPEWLKDITYPGSWLMRCDKCGLRGLFSKVPPKMI
jgi:hypothetical protein